MKAEAAAQISPEIQMFRLITAYWTSQAIGVAARLGVPDRLAAGPRRADEIAPSLGANADALYRLLRLLATVGVVAQEPASRFALTPLGDTLRSDVPGSLRAMAVMQTAPGHWLPWGRLLDSVRSGRPVAREALGKDIYACYAEAPEEAHFFNSAMVGLTALASGELLRVYDFSSVHVIGDIGGGYGSMLAAVLRAYPGVRGLLFDLPEVIEAARPAIEANGISGRCNLVAGDFFEAVPTGADLHLLKHVLHNWDDEPAGQLLRNCRRALASGGRLLIMEFVIPPDNRPSAAQPMDLNMLVNCGGRERTEKEYTELLEGAGFRLARAIPTASPFMLLEAVPA